MVDGQTLPLARAQGPKSLIINSPYERPTHHWRRDEHGGARLELVTGRRPAGYDIFDTRNHTTRWVALAQVALIRERVDAWCAADYPGVTAISRQLLAHWRDPQAASRAYPLYFCQLEAIEMLIWQIEASSEFTQGVAMPGDGGPWPRLCCKMATGSGKTTVMAMVARHARPAATSGPG